MHASAANCQQQRLGPNPSLERDLHRHGTWPARRCRSMLHLAGQAPSRLRPLSSNVRPHEATTLPRLPRTNVVGRSWPSGSLDVRLLRGRMAESIKNQFGSGSPSRASRTFGFRGLKIRRPFSSLSKLRRRTLHSARVKSTSRLSMQPMRLWVHPKADRRCQCRCPWWPQLGPGERTRPSTHFKAKHRRRRNPGRNCLASLACLVVEVASQAMRPNPSLERTSTG